MEENKIEETGNEQHVLEKLMALFPEIPQEELSAGIEELIGTYPEADLEALAKIRSLPYLPVGKRWISLRFTAIILRFARRWSRSLQKNSARVPIAQPEVDGRVRVLPPPDLRTRKTHF